MKALLRPLAIQAEQDEVKMHRVVICLYNYGTRNIDADQARDRIRNEIGPDLEDSTTAAMDAALDVMHAFRDMDGSLVSGTYIAMVNTVPLVCRPNDEEDGNEETRAEEEALEDGSNGESLETGGTVESHPKGSFILVEQ